MMVCLVLAGCSAPPEKKVTEENSLTQVSWSQVASILNQDSELASWADALEASVGYYAALKPETSVRFGAMVVTASVMAKSCKDLAQAARSMAPEAFHEHLQKNYLLFRSVGSDQQGEVLATAYYEPLLQGSLTSTKNYIYPIYRRPHNLVEVNLSEWWPDFKDKRIVGRLEKSQLRPYYDRTRIDQDKVLKGKHLELVWVDDPIELFFLHIQGSGRISLPDGSVMRVGYAATNGQPYRSIGTLLIEEKQITRENMSLPVLRQWLRDNPKERDRVLNSNPSYVFFRKIEGGPFGNIGVALTGERSMATDAHLFPKGAPGMIYVTLPEFAEDGALAKWSSKLRLTVNQDTGGAIRGPGRVDYFMGFGEKAQRTAGIMKQTGASLYFMAPRLSEESTESWFGRWFH
ncbi:MAG: murein transglycosylase A [Magnetococcus sp. YQC-5]